MHAAVWFDGVIYLDQLMLPIHDPRGRRLEIEAADVRAVRTGLHDEGAVDDDRGVQAMVRVPAQDDVHARHGSGKLAVLGKTRMRQDDHERDAVFVSQTRHQRADRIIPDREAHRAVVLSR